MHSLCHDPNAQEDAESPVMKKPAAAVAQDILVLASHFGDTTLSEAG